MGSQSSGCLCPNTFSTVPVISWNQLVSEKPDRLPVERYLPASVHCIICQHCPLLSLAPTPPDPVLFHSPSPCLSCQRPHQKFFALCKFLLFILILVLFFFFFYCMHACLCVVRDDLRSQLSPPYGFQGSSCGAARTFTR